MLTDMYVLAKLATRDFIVCLLSLSYFCSKVKEMKWKETRQSKVIENENEFVSVALRIFFLLLIGRHATLF